MNGKLKFNIKIRYLKLMTTISNHLASAPLRNMNFDGNL